jgi:arylsulfatase A-like enzyme
MTRILIALTSFLLFSAATFAAESAKPNLVVVLFDDMGYGEPGCYRAESKLKTPNLDRLAADGMRFTDAHSASAVCTPTRYGLLTGRYPARIGQYGVLTTYSPPIIPKTRLTVAALLKQHGYDTACIGKWHLGMVWDGNPGNENTIPVGARLKTSPNATGFDYFYGYTHARNISTIIEQDRVVENVAEVANQPRMIAKAVQWIEQRKEGEPFFLYFPMCPPHTPIIPAEDFVGKSGAVDAVKSDPKYGDWVFQGDHMLGQLLDALERKGLAENTLVIAAADNGAAGRPYPPLRGAKTSIYEGGHRVPFIARWPGKIKPGSVSDQTVCHNDLMATCADILGTKLPDNAGEDSVSILPALHGTAKEPLREATVHQSHQGDLAIRKGPWKLIFFRSGKRELYHLGNDLGETRDVAAGNPEVVAELAALMKRYVADGRSTPGARQPATGQHMDPDRPASKPGKNKRAKGNASE